MHEIVEATLDDLELGSAEVVLPKWFCRRGSAELGSAGVVLPAWFCRRVLPTWFYRFVSTNLPRRRPPSRRTAWQSRLLGPLYPVVSLMPSA
jgi:hypothetical protein